jgi:hypothetical protein
VETSKLRDRELAPRNGKDITVLAFALPIACHIAEDDISERKQSAPAMLVFSDMNYKYVQKANSSARTILGKCGDQVTDTSTFSK